MLRLKATRRKGICEQRLHCECSLSAFHLSPPGSDHLPEHPRREPTKVDAASLGQTTDEPPEAAPLATDQIESSQVENSIGLRSPDFTSESPLLVPMVHKKHDKTGEPLQNKPMAEHADAVAPFPGGRGTDSMYREAKRAGITIYDFRQGDTYVTNTQRRSDYQDSPPNC